MNLWKRVAVALLAGMLLAVPLAGCSTGTGEANGETEAEFTYSGGFDDNGFWKDVKALDYVEMFDYKGLSIPSDAHEVSDEEVQTEITSLLASYATTQQVSDRAIVDGDTVNIDYAGTIDGVEFEGGSTGGTGTDVTIGTTTMIDDFIEQLIGHSPGENFDIEVTFPEDYGNEELNGKDAVFNVTINYISETVEADLTDSFVAENLTSSYGWTTVKEMQEGVKAELENSAIQSYIQDYLANDVTVKSIPDSIMKYQEDSLIDYYEYYAESYGMEFGEFLSSFMGVSSTEELLENNKESNEQSSRYYLALQAIAEDAGLTGSDEDVANYFLEYMGTDDYSSYTEEYGMPYLRHVALCQQALDLIADNATLE